MVSSKETTPAGYLASLPPEQRKVIATVRNVVKERLPEGYVESMNWGMLCYEIPLAMYPVTYNNQPLTYMALAAQKNNYALYMMNVYGNPKLMDKLLAAYKASGRRLDMGKSCLRFKGLEELPLDVIGEIVASTSPAEMITRHEAAQEVRSAVRAGAKKSAAKKSPAKKASAAKTPVKKAPVKKAPEKKAPVKQAAATKSGAKRK
jgi:Domain of unknown function (DU1801)